MGSGLAKTIRIAAPVDSNDQTELARHAGLDTRDGILDHRTVDGIHIQTSRRLDKWVRVRFALKTLSRDHVAVHHHGKGPSKSG